MLQRVKDRFLSRICTYVPLDVWHRISGVDLVIPYWHMVCDHEVPHVSGLGRRFRSVRQFKADVEFFLQHYTPVTEQDVICHLHGGRKLPSRSVLFTFDDGFRECHDVVLPVLRASGATAIFFLTTAAIDNKELCYKHKQSLLISSLSDSNNSAARNEIARVLSSADVPIQSDIAGRIGAVSYHQRGVLDDVAPILQCDFRAYLDSQKPYLTAEQVQDLLRQGFAVGAHSIDHPLYSELSLSEQLTQTRDSRRWLSARFKTKCQSFAFPFHGKGVSSEFFREIFSENEIRVCFDTGGFIEHPLPYMLSRFTPELNNLTACETLSRALCRGLAMAGKDRLCGGGFANSS